MPFIKWTNRNLKIIDSYLCHYALSKFLSNYEEILREKDSNYHFTTFGINFKNNHLYSIKFYAHVMENLTDIELKKFIPFTSDYRTFLEFKKDGLFNNENVGTVLELKFELTSDVPSVGFFYKLKNLNESFKKIGFPKKLPDILSEDYISLGVNFEYKKDKILFKKYYYFKNSLNYFDEVYNDLNDTNVIEYAESDLISKFNVYGDFDVNKVEIFTDLQKKLINRINQKYNLKNIGYGFYTNQDIRSVYFISKDSYFDEFKSNVKTISNLLNEHFRR